MRALACYDDTMSTPSDIRLSFDRVASMYHEIRPHYPAELFDVLFSWLPDRPKIVEVGPGTGQATGDLLAHGAPVTAVELGPQLAERLRQEIASPDLNVVVADFEEVELEPGAFDCVFSASAYHWISPQGQRDRPAELLHAGGVLAIVELVQVQSAIDRGFFDAVQPIYQKYGEGGAREVTPSREAATARIYASLQNDPRFTDLAAYHFDWDQTYTSAQYRKLMTSYSGTQMMEPARRQGLLDDIEQFITSQFGGQVTRPLVIILVLARLITHNDLAARVTVTGLVTM
jgi:SAM-dependent methyltransferase